MGGRWARPFVARALQGRRRWAWRLISPVRLGRRNRRPAPLCRYGPVVAYSCQAKANGDCVMSSGQRFASGVRGNRRRRGRSVVAGRTRASEGGDVGPRRDASGGERPRALRDHRRRHAGQRAARHCHPAAGRRVRGRLRSVRRTPRAGARDRAPRSPRDAPLSGAARQQGHRLHRRRRSRSLAPADRRRRRERGEGHLLREADVAQRRRRRRDAGRGEEERTHRADRLAARELADLRQGEGDDRAGRRSAI